MRTDKHGAGFTLVELLVVMAVIAVIISLVATVTLRCRAKGRQSACLSNLRQLGIASLMYSRDYDGLFPPFINTPEEVVDEVPSFTNQGYPRPDLLHAALKSYVGDSKVWFCPNDPIAGQEVVRWGITHKFSSYRFLFRRRFMSEDGYFKLPGIPPTELVLIEDCNFDYIDQLSDSEVIPTPGCEHFHGVNMFYLDGHAQLLKVPRLK